MKNETTNRSTAATIGLLLFKYATMYFAYGFLSPVILISVFFLIFSIINLTGGDLSLLGFDKLLYLLERVGIIGSGEFDETDILSAFAKLTLLVFIAGMLSSFLVKKLKKNNDPLLRVNKFKLGFLTITILMILAIASIYFPGSAENAAGIMPILIFFWGTAIVMYAIFLLLVSFTNKIDPYKTKISNSKVIHLDPKLEKLITWLIPDLDSRVGKIYKTSVASGKWEEIKRNMDPIEAEKIEQYHEKNFKNLKYNK